MELLKLFEDIDDDLPSKSEFKRIAPEIVRRVQDEYEEWDQSDEEYGDPGLGFGGICQNFAGLICDVLSERGIDCGTVSSQVGEQHVWTVAKFAEGVYAIDIPACIYETGGGYDWQKIEGVSFDVNDITFERIDSDPNSFENFLD